MTNSTPTRLLFRKKITAIYADGSSKMNLGVSSVSAYETDSAG